MKVYITSNGCAVLKHETERIAKFFQVNSWEHTMCIESADIIVMTCCGVTHNEENQAIEIIGNIERNRSKSTKFVIGGCLPAFAQKRILEITPSAILLTYQQLDRLNELIGATTPLSEVYYNIHPTLDTELNEWIPNEEERVLQKIDELCGTGNCKEQYDLCTLRKYIWQDKDVYQIKVSYGCPGNCSYCATKLAIGNFRSVPKELVIRQFKEGVEAGYSNFMMVGDEVGCYGSDFEENIITLLNEIHSFAPNISIAIRYIHPDVFVKHYNEFKPYFATGFINYFCCAIQSASPSVLKAMNRNPNIEPFIQCMEDMNKEGYKVNKHTQILVGFPNETEADVLDTIDCLIRCNFDHININKFSPRQGTKAYELKDNIPESIKVKRCSIFRKLMMMNKKEKLYNAINESVSKIL